MLRHPLVSELAVGSPNLIACAVQRLQSWCGRPPRAQRRSWRRSHTWSDLQGLL